MSGRVLVLGGSGFVGRVIGRELAARGWRPVLASRRGGGGPVDAQIRSLALDARQPEALRAALADCVAVVNCVAGDAETIGGGARVLGSVIGSSGWAGSIVHLSSMAVYGGAEGTVVETQAYGRELGWYGDAKVLAEQELRGLAPRLPVTILRPGCIYGPGSDQWVGRVGRLLRAGRIGDLGALGDGWSNLVHVDDVASAVERAIAAPVHHGDARIYNLAAPDSPRWNDYFIGLSAGLGLKPLRRIDGRRLKLDAKLFSVGVKAAGMLAARLRLPTAGWPDPLPPSLLRLWRQQIRLDAGAASSDLLPRWTSFERGLQSSLDWLRRA